LILICPFLIKIDEESQFGEVLKLKLAAGGGWVARITRLK